MKRRSLIQGGRLELKKRIIGRTDRLLVSRHHGVAYLPIPKNANTYLKAVFLKANKDAPDFDPRCEMADEYLARSDKRWLVCKYRHEIKKGKLKVFTVLRPPAKRLVSCYLNKFMNPNWSTVVLSQFCSDVKKVIGRPVTQETLTFRAFFDYVEKIPDFRRDPHYKTQASFLRNIQPEFIGNIENIGETIRFMESCGMEIGEGADPQKFGSVNRTSYSEGYDKPMADVPLMDLQRYEKPPAAAAFYDNGLEERLYDIYRDDIELIESLGK